MNRAAYITLPPALAPHFICPFSSSAPPPPIPGRPFHFLLSLHSTPSPPRPPFHPLQSPSLHSTSSLPLPPQPPPLVRSPPTSASRSTPSHSKPTIPNPHFNPTIPNPHFNPLPPPTPLLNPLLPYDPQFLSQPPIPAPPHHSFPRPEKVDVSRAEGRVSRASETRHTKFLITPPVNP